MGQAHNDVAKQSHPKENQDLELGINASANVRWC